MTGRGFNASRQIAGGTGRGNTTQWERDSAQGGAAPTLQRAVVVDVIYDPTSLTDEQMDWLEDHTVNPELVEGMPYNAILGRVITNSQDLGHPDIHIFYPMWPSHFQLPIKPGEQVLIMYEDYAGTGNAVGYWVTRPMAARQLEDPNYTHADRVFDPLNHPRNMDPNTRRSLNAQAPTFPNGAGTPETFSLAPSGSQNPYDQIVNEASASALVTVEPVPRTKKRPADFALFGSNNTALILGTDRTGPAKRPDGTESKDVVEKAGTIDIVAGLGAVRKLPLDENSDPTEDNHNPTSPRVIQNSRRKKESYKTPYKSQKRDNPKEGDPDFKRDLSRIYVSMKTKGDKNFGIKAGGAGGIFPSSGGSGKLIREIEDLPDDEQNGQPFVGIKSEQIRLIATGKDKDNGPSQHGSLRFIKEGTLDDKDLSMFVMNKEGEIIAVAKDIQLQTHPDGKVYVRCKGDGDENAMVVYDKLKATLNKIIDEVANLAQKTSDGFSGIANTGLSVVNAAGPFSPIPGLIATKAQCIATVAQLNTQKTILNNLKSSTADAARMDDMQSKWLFMSKTGKNE